MKSPKNHPRVFLVPRSCSGCSRLQPLPQDVPSSLSELLPIRRLPRCEDLVPKAAAPSPIRAIHAPSPIRAEPWCRRCCKRRRPLAASADQAWQVDESYTISKGPSAIILYFDFWFVQLYISWYFGKHGGLYFRSLGPLQILAAVHVWSKHPKKEQHGQTVKWSPHFLETWFQLALP